MVGLYFQRLLISRTFFHRTFLVSKFRAFLWKFFLLLPWNIYYLLLGVKTRSTGSISLYISHLYQPFLEIIIIRFYLNKPTLLLKPKLKYGNHPRKQKWRRLKSIWCCYKANCFTRHLLNTNLHCTSQSNAHKKFLAISVFFFDQTRFVKWYSKGIVCC